MTRWNVSKVMIGAVLGVALIGSTEAEATWWGHSSGGSYGSWGSSGGSYGSWGSSGGYASHGSSGGWYLGKHIHQWRARRAHYHHSHGSWGSSGGSYGSWGSSGGSHGSWGSSGGGWMQYDTAPPAGGEAAPPAVPSPSDSAVLDVHVPTQAKVYVNGLPTTSTGAQRRYVSNNLERGYSYSYELRAEVEQNGEIVTETKTVKLQAGQSAQLTFDFNTASDTDKLVSEPVRTKLTLHVPADAKVYLSGNETRSTGLVREFTTTQLSAGQRWDNYVVRVEIQRDGQTLSQEQAISLAAGENRELNVDFDAQQVAQAAR